MSQPRASTPLPASGASATDLSCRLPGLALFLAAALWLLFGSVLALLASIKFHTPNFLADPAWLTYGRIRPAAGGAFLYGFGMQAGLAMTLWMMARLGRTALAWPGLVMAGAFFWNLGVAAGVGGILSGDSTGFPALEFPSYAAGLIFIGYVLMAASGVLAFRQRREREVYVSQWFLLTALFWFPWIYSTAQMLVVLGPARGVLQPLIAWWYSANLLTVWFGLVGLAGLFYFVPQAAGGELHSRYLAIFSFWTLTLFGSWAVAPALAPLPAWITVWSRVATVLLVLPLLTVMLNLHGTLRGRCSLLRQTVAQPFFQAAIPGFAVALALRILGVLFDAGGLLHLTWFAPAVAQCWLYLFFAMAMFGAAYTILPRLAGRDFPFPALVRAHFWLALLGGALIVAPWAAGGWLEAARESDPAIPFLAVVKSTLMFLRISTIGELLLALGHLVFLVNLGSLVARLCKGLAMTALAEATAETRPAEVRA